MVSLEAAALPQDAIPQRHGRTEVVDHLCAGAGQRGRKKEEIRNDRGAVRPSRPERIAGRRRALKIARLLYSWYISSEKEKRTGHTICISRLGKW